MRNSTAPAEGGFDDFFFFLFFKKRKTNEATDARKGKWRRQKICQGIELYLSTHLKGHEGSFFSATSRSRANMEAGEKKKKKERFHPSNTWFPSVQGGRGGPLRDRKVHVHRGASSEAAAVTGDASASFLRP
jgi:hypothetical protein